MQFDLQRRAIGNLLRLADTCNRDAQRLLNDGSLANATMLVGLAVGRIVEAAVASETDRTLPVTNIGPQSLDDENPIKARVSDLAIRTRPEPSLLPDGRVRKALDNAVLRDCIDRTALVLAETAGHFAVNFAGEDPAGNAKSMRPEPVATVASRPLPPVQRSTSRKKASGPKDEVPETFGRTSAEAEPQPMASAVLHTVPGSALQRSRSTSDLSSTVFWSLMDRWTVADLDALVLLGHSTGLTRKGTRPRFKLNPDQIDMLIRQRDIDGDLISAGLDPKKWLRKPVAATPFRGSAPLVFMMQNGLPGARDLGHYVFHEGVRMALRSR